jgi:hypothetical protein
MRCASRQIIFEQQPFVERVEHLDIIVRRAIGEAVT